MNERIEKPEQLLIADWSKPITAEMLARFFNDQPIDRVKIGHQIKNFRLNVLQMGLRRFAEFMGMKPSQLCNVEQGRLPNESLTIEEYERTH